MSSLRNRSQFGLHSARCVLALVLASAGDVASDPVPSSGKPAAYPDWWFTRSVIKRTNAAASTPVWPVDYPQADDFAALNQGQLKQLATAAYDELQASLAGGTGNDVLALVSKTVAPDCESGSFAKVMNENRRLVWLVVGLGALLLLLLMMSWFLRVVGRGGY